MSEFLKLNGKDLGKGLLIAFLAVAMSMLSAVLDAGELPTMAEWLNILKVAGTSAVSYLLKNLFTNSKDVILKAED